MTIWKINYRCLIKKYLLTNTVLYQDATYTIRFSMNRQICYWVCLVFLQPEQRRKCKKKMITSSSSNEKQTIAHIFHQISSINTNTKQIFSHSSCFWGSQYYQGFFCHYHLYRYFFQFCKYFTHYIYCILL